MKAVSTKQGTLHFDHAVAALILSQVLTVFLQAGANQSFLPRYCLFSSVVGQLSQLAGNRPKRGNKRPLWLKSGIGVGVMTE